MTNTLLQYFATSLCQTAKGLRDSKKKCVEIDSTYHKRSIKPPSLISPSPLSQNLKYAPSLLSPLTPIYIKFQNLPNIFNLFSYTTLHVNFSMFWHKNCVEFTYVRSKIVS